MTTTVVVIVAFGMLIGAAMKSGAAGTTVIPVSGNTMVVFASK
tara:strand:+ start:444 stop:572 length:129 start_codon:yes stop_codon:yes gene_type:complete